MKTINVKDIANIITEQQKEIFVIMFGMVSMIERQVPIPDFDRQESILIQRILMIPQLFKESIEIISGSFKLIMVDKINTETFERTTKISFFKNGYEQLHSNIVFTTIKTPLGYAPGPVEQGISKNESLESFTHFFDYLAKICFKAG